MNAEHQTRADEVKAKRTNERDRVLVAALAHVPFDGWGEAALVHGAQDIGLDADTAKRLFPDGQMDAIAHFSDWADRQMIGALAKMDLENMRVRDRVAAGVRARLEALIPYREAVRSATGILASPLHAALAARMAYHTVDEIWFLAGDRSVDFNFYTKRGLLGVVYGPTVLYWLQDASNDFADTWDFLDRRIADVLKIPGIKAKVEARVGGLFKNVSKNFPANLRNPFAKPFVKPETQPHGTGGASKGTTGEAAR